MIEQRGGEELLPEVWRDLSTCINDVATLDVSEDVTNYCTLGYPARRL